MNGCSLVDSKFIVEAVPFGKLASSSYVFNISQVEDILHVKLPEWTFHCDLVSVCQSATTYDYNDVAPEDITRYDQRPWIDIKFSALNGAPGYHIFKMVFQDKNTETKSTIYFAYTLQQDNPEKPYIYMHREDEQ